MTARRSFAALLLLSCAVSMLAMKTADPPGKQMETFANSFLGSLDDTQRSTATMPYDSPQRVRWHFVPMKSRKGLVLSEMNEAQRTAALRLLRATLSEAGYDKANQIMMLETTLKMLEGDGGTWSRDSQKYYLTIFGDPSPAGAWGLSFEGHHLSLNFVCRDGIVVDSTPQFFAANPATIMSDVKAPEGVLVLGKGTRVLRDEEELAFKLLRSMTEEQLSAAVIAEEAPKEIRFAGDAQAIANQPEGIGFGELNHEQRHVLKSLVEVYVNAVAGKVADQRRQRIKKNGWGPLHFAWAGAKKPGIGHYYRVQGKDFLIEFVNTQPDAAGNPANHIHCILRDLTGDFDLP